MSIQLTEAEYLVPAKVRAAPPPAQPLYEIIETEEHERLKAARGITTAIIISAPFWLLAGFTAYMLF
jgi:hypothetical protein